MHLRVLGVGTAFSRTGHVSNFLIENQDFRVLLDCGYNVHASLYEKKISLSNISGTVISHLHHDHIGGLEEFAIKSKVLYSIKPYIISTGALLSALWENSLKGGLEYLEEIPGVSPLMTLEDYFIPFAVKKDEDFYIDKYKDIHLRLVQTDHIKNMLSYGFVFNGNKKKMFISGDTKFSEEYVKKYGEDADIILHDCQLYDQGKDNKNGVHASLQQLKNLPSSLKKKMWLYHYENGMVKPEVSKEFAGYIFEGMNIPI